MVIVSPGRGDTNMSLTIGPASECIEGGVADGVEDEGVSNLANDRETQGGEGVEEDEVE